MSRWIFQAAHEEDLILGLAKWMTLLPTSQRRQLLDRALGPVDRLRRLNLDRFGARPFVEMALDDLLEAMRAIADLPSKASHLDGKGSCTVCGNSFREDSEEDDVYCSTCLEPLMEPLLRLRSGEGFGTEAI